MVGSKKGIDHHELGVGQAIPWDMFKDGFNGHLFPKVVQEAKARDLMNLVQGSLTVAEYAAKFT